MNDDVRRWVSETVFLEKPEPPVLEVGSYNVNGTVRDLFPEPYTGLDMREGPGVDVVADVLTLRGLHYRTVVCVETLEHVTQPWVALRRINDCLLPNGLFVGTWPFMFEEHDYPSDYWRATPAGFRYVLALAGFTEINVKRPWPSHVVATARKAA